MTHICIPRSFLYLIPMKVKAEVYRELFALWFYFLKPLLIQCMRMISVLIKNPYAYDWCACTIPMRMISVRNTIIKVWRPSNAHANHMLMNPTPMAIVHWRIICVSYLYASASSVNLLRMIGVRIQIPWAWLACTSKWEVKICFCFISVWLSCA